MDTPTISNGLELIVPGRRAAEGCTERHGRGDRLFKSDDCSPDRFKRRIGGFRGHAISSPQSDHETNV
jgi:hypothetical protein